MNTELEKIFSHYDLSRKDRHEYMQIFSLLSLEKKRIFVENAPSVIGEILALKDSLLEQQEILMGKTLSRIEEKILQARKDSVSSLSSYELSKLKTSLK